MLAQLGLQTLLSVVAGPLRARVGGGGERLHDRPRRRPRLDRPPRRSLAGERRRRDRRPVLRERGLPPGTVGRTVARARWAVPRPRRDREGWLAGGIEGERFSPTRRSSRSKAAGPSSAAGSPTSTRTARSRAARTRAGSSTSTRTAAAPSTRSGTSRAPAASPDNIAPDDRLTRASSLQERYAPHGSLLRLRAGQPRRAPHPQLPVARRSRDGRRRVDAGAAATRRSRAC